MKRPLATALTSLCLMTSDVAHAGPICSGQVPANATMQPSQFDGLQFGFAIGEWTRQTRASLGSNMLCGARVAFAQTEGGGVGDRFLAKRKVFTTDGLRACAQGTREAPGSYIIRAFKDRADIDSAGKALFGEGWSEAGLRPVEGFSFGDVSPSTTREILGAQSATFGRTLDAHVASNFKTYFTRPLQLLGNDASFAIGSSSSLKGMAASDVASSTSAAASMGFNLLVELAANRCAPKKAEQFKRTLPTLFGRGGAFVYEVGYHHTGGRVGPGFDKNHKPETLIGILTEVVYFRIWTGDPTTMIGDWRFVPVYSQTTPVALPGTEY